MKGIKRFIECLIPVTACNLKCSYCYVAQREKNENKMPEIKYSVKQIQQALTQERLGGMCFFSICGAGETLIPKVTLNITSALLKNGHLVNITTNGTLSERVNQLLSILSNEEKSRLQFAFSFHYLELVRLNLVDTFFNNVKKVHEAGCSFLVQLNLCDDYIPYLDEIKELCIKNVGAYPQIAATRKEINLSSRVDLMTKLSRDAYKELGDQFNSPLFEFTMNNFNVHRNEFCYAGDWTFTLNLATGIMHRCYSCSKGFDIFKNPNNPIPFCAIGAHCKSLFCMNSSHFMTLGVIPDIDTPSYVDIRNRKMVNGDFWYNSNMLNILSNKLEQENSRKINRLKVEKFYLQDEIYGRIAKLYAKLKLILGR